MEATRSRRHKTVSTKLSTVTEDDKKDAMQARIEALENDGNAAEELLPAGSDDEFQLEESEEGTALPTKSKSLMLHHDENIIEV